MIWIFLILAFGLGYAVGFVAARSHYTGIPPEDWQDGTGADDGGPNFH